jgi:hypothetical protein
MLIMIATALAAAVLYGAGAAMEQRQAAAAPQSSAGRPGLLLLLARQPLWLLGIAVQIGGFAAHAVALRSGPLTTVQMVVSAEFVVAVIIVRVWSGRPLSRASWAAALTVVAAVASFLLLTSPGHGHLASQPAHTAATALAAVATGGGALAAAVVGLRAAGNRRALLLAVAAGLADACSAVVTMAFSHTAGHGPVALFTSWTVYAVIACGAGNVLLTQTAYQAGRPMLTLPVIAAVTPVASVAVGIGLLGETPRIGLAGGVAAGFAVLVTGLALAYLARSVPQPETREPATRQAGPAERERIVRPVLPVGLQIDDLVLRRHRDGHRRPREPLRDLVEFIVGAVRLMVEQHDLAGAGQAAKLDRVLGGGVAERGLSGHLLGQQLGVVDEHVGPGRELEGAGVVLTPAVGTRPQGGRAVIGDVGDDRPAVADPVTEGPAALVRDLPRLDGEAAGLQPAGRDGLEAPAAAQLAGGDREVRRRHHPAEHLLGAGAVLLVRHQQGDPSVVMVSAAEERQTLDVVPVHVGEEDGPGKRVAVQQSGDSANARPGVEDERRRRIVIGDGQAGGVPAVADEVRAGHGRRPADPAQVQSHGPSVATVRYSLGLGL